MPCVHVQSDDGDGGRTERWTDGWSKSHIMKGTHLLSIHPSGRSQCSMSTDCVRRRLLSSNNNPARMLNETLSFCVACWVDEWMNEWPRKWNCTRKTRQCNATNTTLPPPTTTPAGDSLFTLVCSSAVRGNDSDRVIKIVRWADEGGLWDKLIKRRRCRKGNKAL